MYFKLYFSGVVKNCCKEPIPATPLNFEFSKRSMGLVVNSGNRLAEW